MSLSGRRGLALTVAFLAAAFPLDVSASGRWYAYVDRVATRATPQALEGYAARGLSLQAIASEGLQGVEPGFRYLTSGVSLFEADAAEAVKRLRALGFKQAGVQYFTDLVNPAVQVHFGDLEPTFLLEAEIDGRAPKETLAVTRQLGGDVLLVHEPEPDGTTRVLAQHPIVLFDLPRITEGEQATVLPLGGSPPGAAVILEAAFSRPPQQSLWTLSLAFNGPDAKQAPMISFIAGARSPAPTKTTFLVDPSGLRYTTVVEGLRGGRRSRTLRWDGQGFVALSEAR